MLDIFTLGIISVLVGFLGSLTGLGGGSILIPIMAISGIPLKEAIAAGMVSIIATSSGSAATFVRQKISNIKIAFYLEMFTITGAIIGAIITSIISPVFLYFFFAAFLLTSFLRVREYSQDFSPAPAQDRISRWLRLDGSYFDTARDKVVSYRVTNSLWGGLGMLIAGLAAGMLGIGAGAFKVTVQDNILKMPPKVSSATSNLIIGMTALAATSVYLFSGLLNLTIVAPIAVGTTIGAIIGSRILNRMSDSSLRILFFVVVAALIIQMLYKGVTAI
jgi:uncharacterized membrane protein YfcA